MALSAIATLVSLIKSTKPTKRVRTNLKVRMFDDDRDRIVKLNLRKDRGKKKTFERDELEAGTYYIRIKGRTKSGKDRYKVRLKVNIIEVDNPATDDPATDDPATDNPHIGPLPQAAHQMICRLDATLVSRLKYRTFISCNEVPRG